MIIQNKRVYFFVRDMWFGCERSTQTTDKFLETQISFDGINIFEYEKKTYVNYNIIDIYP